MGNVIIVKGADYSASDLGKVTILPNNKEIIQQAVAAYYAAAGNVGNVGAINKIVTDLVVNDLWSNVKVLYPILGTTLASQVVDLKGAQDLVPFVNATADTDSMSFVNTIGIGNVDEPQSDIDITLRKRMFLVGLTGKSNVYDLRGMSSPVGGVHTYIGSGNSTIDGSSKRTLRDTIIKGSSAAVYPVIGDYLVGVRYIGDDDNQSVETFQNGVKTEITVRENGTTDSKFYQIPAGTQGLYPNIGGAYNTDTTAGATISANTDIANCNLWFYVEAEVNTTAEAVLLDSICREFCASTGK